MRAIFLILTLALLPSAFAGKKEKTRTPSSSAGTTCFTLRSLEVSKGRYLLNDDFEVVYSTPMGLSLGLQTLTAALSTNPSNDLCISADQDSLDAKKIRSDWPSLAIKPRRVSVNGR